MVTGIRPPLPANPGANCTFAAWPPPRAYAAPAATIRIRARMVLFIPVILGTGSECARPHHPFVSSLCRALPITAISTKGCLPDGNELVADLKAVDYGYDASDAILLEREDDYGR